MLRKALSSLRHLLKQSHPRQQPLPPRRSRLRRHPQSPQPLQSHQTPRQPPSIRTTPNQPTTMTSPNHHLSSTHGSLVLPLCSILTLKPPRSPPYVHHQCQSLVTRRFFRTMEPTFILTEPHTPLLRRTKTPRSNCSAFMLRSVFPRLSAEARNEDGFSVSSRWQWAL